MKPLDPFRALGLVLWSAACVAVTPAQAETRLRQVWELGAMPFAQLFQPPDEYIDYSHDWKALARTWSRPAAMKAEMAK